MTSTLDLRDLTGDALRDEIEDLARLRIAVFRDYPYLYDGNLDYERGYLAGYADSPGSLMVGAFHKGKLVGAATGAPMEDHASEFADALRIANLDARDIYYCAESVLLPEFRGQGVGHAFFDHREAYGRGLGRTWSAFCAVIRPEDHPARPADYSPLNPFWRRRGYEPVHGAIAHFSWKDVSEPIETEKQLQFWIRKL